MVGIDNNTWSMASLYCCCISQLSRIAAPKYTECDIKKRLRNSTVLPDISMVAFSHWTMYTSKETDQRKLFKTEILTRIF